MTTASTGFFPNKKPNEILSNISKKYDLLMIKEKNEKLTENLV